MSPFMTRAKELFSAVKAGDPIPRFDRSVEASTLWPAPIDEEAENGARILRSFFVDGFIVPYRTIGVVEQKIIKKCHGVAVFHLLRDDLSSPTANGSGILKLRLPNGQWSGASSIEVDNKASLPDGVDVLDVVLVINNKNDVEAFLDSAIPLSKLHLTVAPGPIPQSEAVHESSRPNGPTASASIWSYTKSKGELVSIDLSGLVIRQRTEENERYYSMPGISGREILSGHVKTPSNMTDYLSNTIHAFEKQDGDRSGMTKPGRCPGDCRVRAPSTGA